MLTELGMVLGDPSYPLANRARDTRSGALSSSTGSSIATTEANSPRELSNKEVAFCVGLRGPLGIAESARLLEIVFDLGKAPTVRGLGSFIEHLARIAQPRAGETCCLAAT